MRGFGLARVAGVAMVLVVVVAGSLPAGAERDVEPAQVEAVDTGYVLDALDLEGLEVSLTLEHADAFAGMSVDERRRIATIHHREGSGVDWLHDALAAVDAKRFHDTRIDATGSANGRQQDVTAARATPRTAYRVVTRAQERSLAELDAERRKVAASELGGLIVFDRVVAEENAVDITLRAPRDRTKAQRIPAVATEVADAAAVDVHVDWSIERRPHTFVTRRNDRRPHKAGLSIVGPRGQRCSGGPTIRTRGRDHRTMLTAAHCGEWRSRWEQPDGRFVGNMSHRAFGNGYFDSARIRKPYAPFGFAPRMFGGGPNGSQVHWVRGALSARVGGRVCTSGASYGDQCNGARVRQRNVCATFTDIDKRTCFLDVADRTGAGPGDSGGPVYRQRSDGRLVIGTVVGGNSEILLYHPIGRLLKRWDAVLVTR